jgi:uncharacterized damage-inducible protein DinB
MQPKTESELTRLRARLQQVDEELEHELRARGFDPAQIGNIALPTSLARLSEERDKLKQDLQEIETAEQAREIATMNEVERINDQFRRAFEGGAWHGPSVLELLDEVDATKAAAHPVPNAHSIWELTLHIAAWENAAVRRLKGDRAELTDDEDWPAVNDTSEDAWQAAKHKLLQVHRELLHRVAQVDERNLNQPILEGMTSIYGTLHGVVQHDLYHAGQIAVLKKAIQGSA